MVQLTLGEVAGERPLEVELRAAFAEYVVLPELRHELRITLTSYEASCRNYALPSEGQLSVVVTVSTPPHQPPAPGLFDWAGHTAHGGTPERPERAYALPLVRRGPKAYELRPGGGIELKDLRLIEGGALRGLLSFEYPGDGQHPAQALKGSFAGKVCSVTPGAGQRDD